MTIEQFFTYTFFAITVIGCVYMLWDIWSHKQQDGADIIECYLRNGLHPPKGKYICQRHVTIEAGKTLVIKGIRRDWAGRMVVEV